MGLPRMLLRTLTGIVLALPAAAQVQPPVEPPSAGAALRPNPAVLGVDLTYLANEGFLLESGKYSVLIDAFVREPAGAFGALPTEIHKQLANAKPPFDGLTVVLVSHDHPDHVQWRGVEKFLGHNPQAQLITAPQILRSLQDSAQDFAAIGMRVTASPVVRGSIKKLVQEEMHIDFFTLEHHGRRERVFNLGHLIDMGGLRILHVGDADPTPENFAAYDLASKGIDVALVPYWFFGSPAGVKTLYEDIRPRIVVACHVPPAEVATFEPLLKEQFPEVVLFTEALQKRSFQPAGAAEAAPPADPDTGD